MYHCSVTEFDVDRIVFMIFLYHLMSYLCLDIIPVMRFILLFGKLEVPSKWSLLTVHKNMFEPILFVVVIIIFDSCVMVCWLMLIQHEPVFDTMFSYFV